MVGGGATIVLIGNALSLAMIPGLVLLHLGVVPRASRRGVGITVLASAAVVALVWLTSGPALVSGDRDPSVLIGIDGVLAVDPRLVLSGTSIAGLETPAVLMDAFPIGVLAVAGAAVVAVTARARLGGRRSVLLAALWVLGVFAPVAGWVYVVRWDGGRFIGGWLGAGLWQAVGTGALDYAGGSLHIALGAGLLALVTLARRSSAGGAPPLESVPRLSGPAVLAGAFLLWVGGVGAVAAAEGAADPIAALAVVNAITAPAGAGLAWLLVDQLRWGRATPSSGIRGVIAGVAVISSGAGFVTPALALLLGLGVGALGAATLGGPPRPPRALQPTRDLALIHVVGGVVGALALGLAATATGALYSGSILQLVAQLALCVAVGSHAFVVTWLLGWAVGFAGLRNRTGAERTKSVQEPVLT